jgi:hypothetical protein
VIDDITSTWIIRGTTAAHIFGRAKSTRIIDKESDMAGKEQRKIPNLLLGVVTIGLLLWFAAISVGLGFVTTHSDSAAVHRWLEALNANGSTIGAAPTD